MTEVLDHAPSPGPTATELMSEVRRVLAASSEPLTLSKIRAHLPTALRTVPLETISRALEPLVEHSVIYKYEPYRSPHPRFWDRPMPEHLAALIEQVLTDEGPLAWPQLHRKLPSYVKDTPEKMETIGKLLEDQVRQQKLYLHPASGSRSGKRYGIEAPDPREPLRKELPALFDRLERQMGFTRAQLREAAIELLHEEEWESPASRPESAAEATAPAATEPADGEAPTPPPPPTTES
jgi:hypothetical protein